LSEIDDRTIVTVEQWLVSILDYYGLDALLGLNSDAWERIFLAIQAELNAQFDALHADKVEEG
jgi:hypothetical protein